MVVMEVKTTAVASWDIEYTCYAGPFAFESFSTKIYWTAWHHDIPRFFLSCRGDNVGWTYFGNFLPSSCACWFGSWNSSGGWNKADPPINLHSFSAGQYRTKPDCFRWPQSSVFISTFYITPVVWNAKWAQKCTRSFYCLRPGDTVFRNRLTNDQSGLYHTGTHFSPHQSQIPLNSFLLFYSPHIASFLAQPLEQTKNVGFRGGWCGTL